MGVAVNVPNSEFLWILGGATPTCVNGIIQSLVNDNDNVNDKYELLISLHGDVLRLYTVLVTAT